MHQTLAVQDRKKGTKESPFLALGCSQQYICWSTMSETTGRVLLQIVTTPFIVVANNKEEKLIAIQISISQIAPNTRILNSFYSAKHKQSCQIPFLHQALFALFDLTDGFLQQLICSCVHVSCSDGQATRLTEIIASKLLLNFHANERWQCKKSEISMKNFSARVKTKSAFLFPHELYIMEDISKLYWIRNWTSKLAIIIVINVHLTMKKNFYSPIIQSCFPFPLVGSFSHNSMTEWIYLCKYCASFTYTFPNKNLHTQLNILCLKYI